MKLIKKGRPQRGWAKQITCTGKGHGRGGCGAVLMVEEGDLLRGERWVMGRDHEVWVYFKCSECGVNSEVTNYPGDINKLRTAASLEPKKGFKCAWCDADAVRCITWDSNDYENDKSAWACSQHAEKHEV